MGLKRFSLLKPPLSFRAVSNMVPLPQGEFCCHVLPFQRFSTALELVAEHNGQRIWSNVDDFFSGLLDLPEHGPSSYRFCHPEKTTTFDGDYHESKRTGICASLSTFWRAHLLMCFCNTSNVNSAQPAAEPCYRPLSRSAAAPPFDNDVATSSVIDISPRQHRRA